MRSWLPHPKHPQHFIAVVVDDFHSDLAGVGAVALWASMLTSRAASLTAVVQIINGGNPLTIFTVSKLTWIT